MGTFLRIYSSINQTSYVINKFDIEFKKPEKLLVKCSNSLLKCSWLVSR